MAASARAGGAACLVFALAIVPAQAQPVLDGTLGPRTPLAGPDYQIPATLGATRGQNLFHSFSDFSLRAGERATFTGPSGLRNVIARVTGGQSSTIDGALRSEVPGANLYFLNPSGVLFGPNAALRVDGSFWVSTADYLRLADGGRFDAREPGASVLTAAAPAAWGFLVDRPAGVEFAGARARIASIATDLGMQAGAGADFGVVAGDIRLGNGTSADGSAGGAWLLGNGGRIQLTAVGSRGEWALPGSGAASTASATGPITLSGDAYVQQDEGSGIAIRGGQVVLADRAFVGATSAVGENPGAIVIESERLSLRDQANIASLALGTSPGPAIELRAADAVEAIGRAPASGSGRVLVSSISAGAGSAGDVRIEAGRIRWAGNAALFGNAEAQGNGPALRLVARTSIDFEGDASLVSKVNPDSTGNGGPVLLAAPTVSLREGSFVWSVNEGAGMAGDVQIDASERFQLSGNALLFGGALASGPGGRIAVTARSITIEGGSISGSTDGQGAASPIVLRGSQSITVTGGGSVVSTTNADGAAGRISIEAPVVVVEGGRLSTGSGALLTPTERAGPAGELIVTADAVRISGGASLDSITHAAGRGGLVQIRARNIDVSGSRTSITALSAGAGPGGSVELQADANLSVSDQAVISAGASSSGSAGSIRLQAGENLALSSKASVLNVSTSDGRAGDIELRAPQVRFSDVVVTSSASSPAEGPVMRARAGDILIVADRVELEGSRIYTTTSSLGAAGSIVVRAGEFQQRGGLIDASTSSSARAGAIDIEARNGLSVVGGGRISTLTSASGAGGSIRLAGQRIEIADRVLVDAISFGAGDAGNILIEARDSVNIAESSIATVAVAAKGGNITLNAPARVVLRNAAVTASVGGAGNGGNIVVDPQFVVLQGNSALTANAVSGDGGNITIRITEGGAFLQAPSAVVSASSEFGVDGTVVVEGPTRDVSSGLRALNTSYLDAAALVRTACAARKVSSSSSLVLRAGRDGAGTDQRPLPVTLFDLVEGGAAAPRPRPAPVAQAFVDIECGR